MKKILFIGLVSLPSFVHAEEWKVIAKTSQCEEKILVLGKEGEKLLKAVCGIKQVKLYPKDGDSFYKNSMSMKEYISDDASDEGYTFFRPGQVEANPPKIIVTRKGRKIRCQMELVH